MRGLEEHVGGGGRDLGVLAAHDPGQADHAVGIGDHQELRVDGGVVAVEQLQGFAIARIAHADRSLEQVAVVGMHRLPELEHQVLGDIDQEADRTHAAATQAFGHPHRGRGGRVHTLQHTTYETRRVGARMQFDRQGRIVRCGNRHRVQRLDLGPGGRGHVEGDAVHAEAIRAVRRQLQFDAGIGQAEVLRKRRADRRVGR